MDTVLINKLQYLQIGVQGENAANNIPIDMTPWVEEFPNANFYLLFKPYNSTSPLPMVTEYDGETHIMTWTPTLSATATPGVGYTEVRALDVDNGVLKKSRIIPTTVENSTTGVEGGMVPMPYEDWVNLVLAAREDSIEARDDAEDARDVAIAAKEGAEEAEAGAVTAKEASEAAAATSQDAEAWAVGTRGGVPVGPTEPQYENNAEYYARTYDAMTAEAESLPYDSQATVQLLPDGDHKKIKFGIPVGTPGSSDPNFYIDGGGYLCQMIEQE